MHEKKNSFKQHFAQYYTITAKNLYDWFKTDDFNRTQNEAFLQQKIEEMTPLLRQSNAFAYITNSTQVSFSCTSSNIAELVGYSKEDWDNRGLPLFIDSFCLADVESNEFFFKKMLSHQEIISVNERRNYLYTTNFRFFHKNGYYVWLLCHSVFLHYNTAGKIMYVFNIIRRIDSIKPDDSSWLQIAKINENGELPTIISTDKHPAQGLNNLSKTEIKIIELLSHGLDNMDIAVELELKESTIKSYRKTLLQKTWCSNTVELVSYAVRNNLI